MSKDCFSTISMIGQGSFAKVLLARQNKNKKVYALKVIDKKTIGKKTTKTHVKNEQQILKKLQKCPFVINYKGSFQTQDNLCFVLQYCPGGDLYEFLQKKVKFSEDQAKFFGAQLVLALENMHSRGVIYRDLKPENILLDQDGYLRVTDFGLSFLMQQGKQPRDICGTPEYLSPEMIKEQKYNHMIDWWALGCLLYELLVGVPPFYSDDRDELFSLIKYTEPRFPKYLSKDAVSLISGLLSKKPRQRRGFKGAKDIKGHPWFSVVNWRYLEDRRYDAPFKPIPDGRYGLSNFDSEFTDSAFSTDILDIQDFENVGAS